MDSATLCLLCRGQSRSRAAPARVFNRHTRMPAPLSARSFRVPLMCQLGQTRRKSPGASQRARPRKSLLGADKRHSGQLGTTAPTGPFSVFEPVGRVFESPRARLFFKYLAASQTSAVGTLRRLGATFGGATRSRCTERRGQANNSSARSPLLGSADRRTREPPPDSPVQRLRLGVEAKAQVEGVLRQGRQPGLFQAPDHRLSAILATSAPFA